MTTSKIETERKFLVKFPNFEELINVQGCKVLQITQIYLLSPHNCTQRIRKINCNGNESFIFTKKIRISPLSCIEDEKEISKDEYEKLLSNKNPKTNIINKTRFSFPFSNHTMEIDIYDFWKDRAILEIELSDENEEILIPEFISVIKEVTNDKRYKNLNLSINVICDDIPL